MRLCGKSKGAPHHLRPLDVFAQLRALLNGNNQASHKTFVLVHLQSRGNMVACGRRRREGQGYS